MFATIWYAGIVVFTLGYNGMTVPECENLKSIMQTDIHNGYVEHNGEPINGYIERNFEVTCEYYQIDIGFQR